MQAERQRPGRIAHRHELPATTFPRRAPRPRGCEPPGRKGQRNSERCALCGDPVRALAATASPWRARPVDREDDLGRLGRGACVADLHDSGFGARRCPAKRVGGAPWWSDRVTACAARVGLSVIERDGVLLRRTPHRIRRDEVPRDRGPRPGALAERQGPVLAVIGARAVHRARPRLDDRGGP